MPTTGSRRIWLKTAALSIVGFTLLCIVIVWADPARVAATLRTAEPMWLGLAIAALVAATVIGAANSFLMTVHNAELKFSSFLAAYWCSWALGQLIPGQVGDLIGISLYLRRRGIALPSAVGRLGVDKLISLFALLLLAGGLLLVYEATAPRLAGALALGAAFAMLLAYGVSLRWNVATNSDAGFVGKMMRVLGEAHAVMKNRPAIVVVNLCLTVIKLSLIGICYWATFCAFGASLANLRDVAITANSAGLVAYVPISANGLGTVEATALYLFGLLGVAAPVVIATYLTLRVASLVLALGGAAIILLVSAAFA